MPKTEIGQRASQHITRKATQNAFRAFDYAPEIASPLNNYCVLRLHESATSSGATIFREFRHKFRDWYNRRTKQIFGFGRRPIYVGSFENPDSGSLHVNWAVHIPPALQIEFETKAPGWLAKVQGPLGPYDFDMQPIDENSAKRLAKYILKGTDPAFTDHFYLRDLVDKHGPQGTVYGRRLVVSTSIGATARRTAGWQPKRRRSRQWSFRSSSIDNRPSPSL